MRGLKDLLVVLADMEDKYGIDCDEMTDVVEYVHELVETTRKESGKKIARYQALELATRVLMDHFFNSHRLMTPADIEADDVDSIMIKQVWNILDGNIS